MKRPQIIEFSGLPNSGKTTLLHNLQEICQSNNVNACIVQEPAELLPICIPKGSVEQNFWITLETLQMCLKIKNITDVDFILLDRGFYNQLFWSSMYQKDNPKYSEYVYKLITDCDKMFSLKPDYLFVVDVSVEEAIRRRMQNGGSVTFSKTEFLKDYKDKFQLFYKEIYPRYYIDSTNMTPEQVVEQVFKTIMSLN